MSRVLALGVALLATAVAGGRSVAQEAIDGPACVVDGQTLFVGGSREQGRCHGGVKIRLHGIAAPDPEQRCATATGALYACGVSALNALEDLTWRRQVRCAPVGPPARDRAMPAVCHAAEDSLNAEMVRKGWAVVDKRDGEDFLAEEEEARAGLRGMWAGRFDLPWQWRQEKRR